MFQTTNQTNNASKSYEANPSRVTIGMAILSCNPQSYPTIVPFST